MHGVVVSIEVKIQRRADVMRVGVYAWRCGIEGGSDTKTRRYYARRYVWI